MTGPDFASIEATTRDIPYDANELRWQLLRPRHLWTPIPAPGELVCYRNDEWGPVSNARVVAVQSLDDRDDHYLWDVATVGGADGTERRPLEDGAGRRVKVARADPWLDLTLDTEGYGRRVCREARVRGSAGWLPLDWRTRARPIPAGHRLVAVGAL